MFDSGNSLDHAIDALYDPIVAMQRVAVDLERDYRELAQRNDIATDTLGVDTTPGEAIATVTEALNAMREAPAKHQPQQQRISPHCSTSSNSPERVAGRVIRFQGTVRAE